MRRNVQILIFFLSSFSLLGQGIVQATPAELQQLVDQALANNPEVTAVEEKVAVAEQQARQQGLLADPMAMLKIQNGLIKDPFDFDKEPNTAKVVGLSQTFPSFGKLDLQRDSADLNTDYQRLLVEEKKLLLASQVKQTWYRLGAVDRALETVEKNILALNDLLRLSETMYGVGTGLQQDVLEAQLQRSKMEEMRIGLEESRHRLVARLNSQVFRPVDTMVEKVPAATMPELHLSQEELEGLAFEHRPLLAAMDTQLERATVQQKLAQKSVYPDFTMAFEYMQREPTRVSEGDDMYTATLSFNLPVRRQRIDGGIQEAIAQNRQVASEIKALDNTISLEIAENLATLNRSRRLVDLYRGGLLEQASAVHETAIATYRVGKTDFLKVLGSRIAIFNLERDYHEAVADFFVQLVRLEAVVGVQLQ